VTIPTSPDESGRELRQLVEKGRYREALEAYRRGGDLAARAPETTLLAATAATRVGELGPAVTLAETALQQFRSRTDGDGRMRAMNLLGAIAFEQGRLKEADRCFGEALELARSLQDTRMAAHASNNLASVAHLQNRPEEALSLYRAALLAYQRLGDRRGTSQTYHNLGLVFRQQRDWEDADAAALEAVRHAEVVGDGALLALAVAGRAEFHIDRGDFDLAKGELGRAERHAAEARDDVGLVETRRLTAMLALQTSDLESAVRLAREAREAAEQLGVLQLQAECAVIAARALTRLGRPEEAAACRTEAIGIFGRLGAEKLRDDLLREPLT
jgi:tetratricopeptide (TPR) repeat protein